jgi:hypothetical protein
MAAKLHGNKSLKWALAAVVLLFLIAALALAATPALAGAGKVTRGDFRTFAAGLERGYQVSGEAIMVRTARGTTQVTVMVNGLAPDTSYPVHVHNAPCAVNNGGGHYQHVVGGPVDPYNEIWPLVTTNASGAGKGRAYHAYTARPEAQAVVVHDTDGARLACADLQ